MTCIRYKVFVKPVSAVNDFMARFLAQLTSRPTVVVVVAAVVAAVVATVVAVVAAAAVTTIVAAVTRASVALVTTAPAAAAVSATAPLLSTPTTTSTGGDVDRRLAQIASLKHVEAGVEAQELAIQLLNRNRFDPHRQGRDHRVVVDVEAGDDMGDDLGVSERCTGAGNFICKGFNFPKIFCHG